MSEEERHDAAYFDRLAALGAEAYEQVQEAQTRLRVAEGILLRLVGLLDEQVVSARKGEEEQEVS